jgi:hypothetical protein
VVIASESFDSRWMSSARPTICLAVLGNAKDRPSEHRSTRFWVADGDVGTDSLEADASHTAFRSAEQRDREFADSLRWREQDSNPRSPVRRAAVLSLPPSPAEAVVVVAEVMVPAEIVAQIARLRSPTADAALPRLCWKVE